MQNQMDEKRRKIEQDFLRDLSLYKSTGQYPELPRLPPPCTPPKNPLRQPMFWLGLAAICLVGGLLLPLSLAPATTAVAVLWGIWWGTRG